MCYVQYSINRKLLKPLSTMMKIATQKLTNIWCDVAHYDNNAYLVISTNFGILMVKIEQTINERTEVQFLDKDFGIDLIHLSDMLKRSSENFIFIEHQPDNNIVKFINGVITTEYATVARSGINYKEFTAHFSEKNPVMSLTSDYWNVLKTVIGSSEYGQLILNPIATFINSETLGKSCKGLMPVAMGNDGSLLIGIQNLMETLGNSDLFNSDKKIKLYPEYDYEFLYEFYQLYKGEHNDFSRVYRNAKSTAGLIEQSSEQESEGVCNTDGQNAQFQSSEHSTEDDYESDTSDSCVYDCDETSHLNN